MTAVRTTLNEPGGSARPVTPTAEVPRSDADGAIRYLGGSKQPIDAELTAIAGLVSAADKVPYFTGSGTAALADMTAAGRALLDDATATDQRTTLGVGTTDSPQFAGIELGHATDTTISRASAGRIAVEGSNVLMASDVGTSVQAHDAGLDDIAALAVTDGNIIVGDGTHWVAESGATARTSLGLGTGDSPQFTAIELGHASDTTISRVSAGRVAVEGSNVLMASDIGTSVQAQDAELAAIAGLASAADKAPYFTGSGTAALADLTPAGRALIDDASATDQRTTLGVGTDDSPQFAGINIGHASDTTITRTAAGDIAVEGNAIYRAGGTDVPVTDGGTGASTAAGARTNLGVGVALLASGTVSNAASLDIVLSSYTACRGLVFDLRLIPATDNVVLYARFSTDGGTNYDVTGYNWAMNIITNTPTDLIYGSGSDTKIEIAGAVGNGSNEGIHATIKMLGQTSTSTWQRIISQSSVVTSDATPSGNLVSASGQKEATQDTDAIRFLFSSGNISSGSYAVYGLL